MTLFHIISLIISLVALFGYLNYRFVKLPEPVGITAVGLVASIGVALVGTLDPELTSWARVAVRDIDFTAIVFQGLLGLLLFAGSLHVNWDDIRDEKWSIAVLATVGVFLSTVIVGVGLYFIAPWLGFPLPMIECLLFGALISPTDPIAVLGLLKSLGVSKELETKIAGESLFNDGTGVVVFIAVLGLSSGETSVSVSSVASLLLTEVVGGALIGLAIGSLGVFMLKGVDSYAVEILITLAMATGGYALAEALHTSAPIAAVLMGLIVGNQGRRLAMSEETRQHLFSFWKLVDELLNLVLFGLIGIEFIALSPSLSALVPGLVAIVLVLLARWVSVALPVTAMRSFLRFAPHTITILTWGGLRGGISIALALSLPSIPGREIILAATYGVVIFSILGQALTLRPLIRHLGL